MGYPHHLVHPVSRVRLSRPPLLHLLLVLLALLAVGCGSKPAVTPSTTSTPAAAKPEPKPAVLDAPLALGSGKLSSEFVPDKILGIDEMPGGNLGAFVSEGGIRYQRFAITHRTEAGATITLATLVRRLRRLKTIHGYEGFRGPIGEKNYWIFRSGKVVAGVIGLPDDDAKIEFARMAYSLR